MAEKLKKNFLLIIIILVGGWLLFLSLNTRGYIDLLFGKFKSSLDSTTQTLKDVATELNQASDKDATSDTTPDILSKDEAESKAENLNESPYFRTLEDFYSTAGLRRDIEVITHPALAIPKEVAPVCNCAEQEKTAPPKKVKVAKKTKPKPKPKPQSSNAKIYKQQVKYKISNTLQKNKQQKGGNFDYSGVYDEFD